MLMSTVPAKSVMLERSTEDCHWNDAILLIGQTIDQHSQVHHQTMESGMMRSMSFINLPVHYTDLTKEELPTDVVDIDVTEGVEDIYHPTIIAN